MFKFTFLAAFIILRKYAFSEYLNISEIPAPYQMDDYEKCKQQQDLYCHLKIILQPLRNDTQIWQKIQLSKDTLTSYSRDILYSAACVSKNFADAKPDAISQNVTQKLDMELKNVSLRSSVVEITCNNRQYHVTIDNYDNILFLSIACYLALIIYATYCDVTKQDFWGDSFSLKTNWSKFTHISTNPDFVKLKSMQGMRSVIMTFVVLGHGCFLFTLGYIKDVEYIELLTTSYIKQSIVGLGLHIVQIFFVMSSWLLALQVHKTVELYKCFSARHAFIIFANRYLRLLPSLIVMILTLRSSYVRIYFDGPYFHYLMWHQKACQDKWWTNLLFINNFINVKDMCNPTTWYLSVDTQMFAISLLLLYFLHKYKINMKILGLILLGSYLTHAAYLYYHDVGLMLIHKNPDLFMLQHFFDPDAVIYKLYLSTISNASTYMLGLCFGSFYYYNNHRVLPKYKIFSLLWALIMFGVPILIMVLSVGEYTRIAAAFTGALLKPLLGFGTGIGILGMQQNLGGFIKNLFESQWMQYLAKISYSTYVFHFAVILVNTLTSNEPLRISGPILFFTSFQQAFLAMLSGFICYMLIELPFENLCNLLLKRLLKNKESSDKKVQ